MEPTLRKQDLDGNVETILLTLLSEKPNYGYGIVKTLNERAEGMLKLGEGTIYPVLHRLEEKELIEAEWGKSPDSGRKRKYYHITPRGHQVLSENRSYWEKLVQVMQRIGVSEENSPKKPPRLGTVESLITGGQMS